MTWKVSPQKPRPHAHVPNEFSFLRDGATLWSVQTRYSNLGAFIIMFASSPVSNIMREGFRAALAMVDRLREALLSPSDNDSYLFGRNNLLAQPRPPAGTPGLIWCQDTQGWTTDWRTHDEILCFWGTHQRWSRKHVQYILYICVTQQKLPNQLLGCPCSPLWIFPSSVTLISIANYCCLAILCYHYFFGWWMLCRT